MFNKYQAILKSWHIHSKIPGIAIKCYVGAKGSVGGIIDAKQLVEVECPESNTQCTIQSGGYEIAGIGILSLLFF